MEETPAPEEPERVQVARAETPELPEPPEEPAPAAEAPVAPQPSAPAAPQPLADRPEPTEGRFEGNVSNRGFTGFEAMRSDMAPYFLEVRRKVEATWRAVLQVRYSGNEATRCVIDCVIAPDGSLVRAKILEAGDSPTFASLCKMAIERAAPFGPFPVDVPEYYRSRNLEIRWTFSFYD
jgi:outer membrane biosynthesis protein TonB